MSEVTLTGTLVCASAAEAVLVERLLPQHVLSTRAEPGCLSFEVTRRGSSLVWDVAERFEDADAFRSHQVRAAESAWGVETAAIRREYTVAGLSVEQPEPCAEGCGLHANGSSFRRVRIKGWWHR